MTTFFRLVKWAIQNFFRQFWLSVVTMIIIALSLFSLSLLFNINLLTDLTIKNLKEKVAVNVYLKPGLSQAEIETFKNQLLSLPETKEIVYLSAEEALKNFQEKYKKNPLIVKSLEVLEANPLGVTLIVKAKTIDGYQSILSFVNDIQYENIIADRDFREPQKIISYLEKISQKIFSFGLIIVLIFIFITMITIFNSVRLAIYTRQEEIKIMDLVGATSSYIKTPFILESIFYVFGAWLINISIFWGLFNFFSLPLADFLEIDKGILISRQQPFIYFALALLFFTSLFSITSSSLAVKRYIKT